MAVPYETYQKYVILNTNLTSVEAMIHARESWNQGLTMEQAVAMFPKPKEKTVSVNLTMDELNTIRSALDCLAQDMFIRREEEPLPRFAEMFGIREKKANELMLKVTKIIRES